MKQANPDDSRKKHQTIVNTETLLYLCEKNWHAICEAWGVSYWELTQLR